MLISRTGSQLIEKDDDDDVSRTLTIPPIKCQPTTKPWLTGWTGWISVKFQELPNPLLLPPLPSDRKTFPTSPARILYNLIRDDYNTKDTVSLPSSLHHNPELCILYPVREFANDLSANNKERTSLC